jgi:hypothetical protein
MPKSKKDSPEQGINLSTEQESLLWSSVQSRYESARSAKQPFETEWKKNNRYRKGDQWDASVKGYREKPVTNYVNEAISTRVASLVEEIPSVIIEARGQEQEQMAADLTQWVRYCLETNDLPMLLDQWEDNRVEGGTAIWRIRYDPKMNGTGGIRVEVIDAANLFPDPAATKLSDCAWVILAVPRTVDYVYEQYGVNVEPDDNVSDDTEIYNNQPGDTGNSGKRVMVLEMLERQRGGKWKLVTAANNRILRTKDGFLNRLPYVAGHFERLRKCFWGRGLVTPYLTTQDRINKLDAVFLDNARMTANLQKAVRIDLLPQDFDYRNFTNEPGLVVPQLGEGEVVRPIRTQGVPGYIRDMRSTAVDEWQRLTGANDIQRGENPTGRPTGALVDRLLAAGDRKNRRLKLGQHAAFKEMAEIIVELGLAHCRYPQTLKVSNASTGQPDYFPVDLSKYAEDGVSEVDVRILPGPGLPDSGAYRAQIALDLADRKMIDQLTVLRRFGFPDAEEIVQRMKADADEERMKSVQMQVYQNQLGIQMKQQSEGAAPTTEEGGSPAPSGVDTVADKLNALSPEELAAFSQLTPEQQMQEIQGLADTPLSQQEAAALIQALQPQ